MIKRYLNLPVLLVVFITLLLIVIWFKGGYLMGSSESALPFYDLNRYFNITSHAWAYPVLGNATGIFTASAPTYYILGLIQKVGIQGFVIEAFVFWFLLLVGGLFMYYLTRLLFKDIDKRFALLAALFYIFNLFTLVNIWQRFLYNYIFFWSLLPLFLYLYLSGLIKKKFIYALLIPIVILIFSYTLTSTPFLIILISLAIYTSLFYLFFKKYDLLFLLKFNFVIGFLFLLTNAWWISQLMSFLFSSSYEVSVKNFFSSQGNIDTLNVLSRSLGKLINITRLYHGTFFSQTDSWLKVFGLFPLSLIFFIIPTVIFSTLIKHKRKFSVLYLSGLYLIAIFLSKGSNPPFGDLYSLFFSKYTYLQVFRNPFEKFGFILTLTTAPLFAYGVYKLSGEVIKIIGRLIVFFAVMIIFVTSLPFWTGEVLKIRTKESKEIDFKVEVPYYYKEANDWLNKEAGEARMIVFPLGDEGITYNWERSYSGVELTSNLFDVSAISYKTTIPYYSEIAENLEQELIKSESILSVMSILNTKYILFRPDVNWKIRNMRDPFTISDRLRDNAYLEKEKRFGELEIWANTNWMDNKINVSNKVTSSLPVGLLRDVKTLKDGGILASYNKNDLSIEPFEDKLIIHPKNAFYIDKIVELGFEERQDIFPHIKYLPSHPLHKLIKIKEWLDKLLIRNNADLTMKEVTYLGKRLNEVQRSIEAFDTVSIKQALDDYERGLTILSDVVASLNAESITTNNKVWNQEYLYGIFVRHSNAFDDFSNLTNDTATKENLVNSKTYLRNFMSDMGIAPYNNYINVEGLPVEKRHTYQFEIKEPGDYELFLEDRDWSNYYENFFLEDFPLQLNGNIVTTKISTASAGLISLGRFDLSSGVHELGWDTPKRRNLLNTNGEDYVLKVDHDEKEIAFKINHFDPYSSYEVSFDYWPRVGGGLTFSFEENNDPIINGFVRAHFLKYLGPDYYYRDFRNFSATITPDKNSDSAEVVFKAKPINECEDIFRTSGIFRCRDPVFSRNYDKTTEIILKNIKIYKVMDIEPSLVKTYNNLGLVLPEYKYSKINPTEFAVEINNATDPFILNFSELYNSGWKTIYEDGSIIDEKNHFLANIYSNAWLIDKKGSYKLKLKYQPQDYLEKGKKISLLSTLIVVALLSGLIIFKKHETKN